MMSQAPDVVFPRLVSLQGGEFSMGTDDQQSDRWPVHRVILRPFEVAAFPVTNREYACYLEHTKSAPPGHLQREAFDGAEQPVVGVSWEEARAYCAWLTGLNLGRVFDLPTEAQREYAALGGLRGARWPWGDLDPARVPTAQEIRGLTAPHAAHSQCANGYGLYCMADNIREWCRDFYDAGYYARSPLTDPSGPGDGTRRVCRGGSWAMEEGYVAIAERGAEDPNCQARDLGFRVIATRIGS
jgi:formylglycine-generating enzyme required for sulfatase activity